MWPPCALFRDDTALGGALVEIADEVVRSLLERGHPEAEGLARRDHFLDAEIVALELLGRRVLVGDDEDEGRACGHRDLLRGEAVILDSERDLGRIRRPGGGPPRDDEEDKGPDEHTPTQHGRSSLAAALARWGSGAAGLRYT